MAFTKIGGNPQTTEVYNNWSEGRCHGPRKTKHACKSRNGTHPATEHAGQPGTGHWKSAAIASRPNTVAIRPSPGAPSNRRMRGHGHGPWEK